MWRGPAATDRAARAARWVTLAATALFWLVVCRWRPWTLFDAGGFSADFYDHQARSFWSLHFDVPASVAGIEGFLIGGKTYLYYGPFLALVRMPLVLTGTWFYGRLARVSMLTALVLACTAAFHLLRRVQRAWPGLDGADSAAEGFGGRLTPWRAAVFVGAVAASPVLALAGWVSVYHETELWAFALFLWTAVRLLDLLHAPSPRHVRAAGLLAVATVLTRASVGIGALVAVGLVAVVLWRRDHRPDARRGLSWAVAGLLANSLVNYAKVGTWLDLPADRQVLTLQSPARAAWFAGNGGSFFSPRFLPTTVVQYLRPDAVHFERLVPFVKFGPNASDLGSYPLEGNTASSSLTVAATALCLLAVIGAVMVVRRRAWWLAWPWAGAVVAAAPTLMIGFIANRYLVDLLPVLVLPAAVAAVAWRPARARLWKGLALAGLVWGAWANVAFAVWTSELKNPGFTSWRYQIDDAVFGGAPPNVVDVVPGGPVPSPGTVGIDGACDGLYIVEDDHWVPLELAWGARRIAFVMPALTADHWEQTLITTGDGVLTAIRADSTGLTWDPTDGESSAALVPAGALVEVVADPVAGGMHVVADGTEVMFLLASPDLSTATLGEGIEDRTPTDRGTPICDAIAARR